MVFKQNVIEALGYYVYALIDPRDKKIFYIGKGKGNRVFQHAEDALNENMESLKLNTIREIHANGMKVEYYILRHRLTEDEAFLVESSIIDLLTFPAFNIKNVLTNIVSGHHQWDEGIKSIADINIIYDCAKVKNIPEHRLLLVSLNKTYNQSQAKGVYIRPDIYEATRKYWVVDINKARKADYVLGVYKGVVRAVYKPTKWFASKVDDYGKPFNKNKTRYGFEGVEVSDSPYLHKDISDYPFGSGGAITYAPREAEYWL